MQRLWLSMLIFKSLLWSLHFFEFGNSTYIFGVNDFAAKQKRWDRCFLNFIDSRWWPTSGIPRARLELNCAIFIFINLIYCFGSRILELQLLRSLFYGKFFNNYHLYKEVANLIRDLIIWTIEVAFVLLLHYLNYLSVNAVDNIDYSFNYNLILV